MTPYYGYSPVKVKNSVFIRPQNFCDRIMLWRCRRRRRRCRRRRL